MKIVLLEPNMPRPQLIMYHTPEYFQFLSKQTQGLYSPNRRTSYRKIS